VDKFSGKIENIFDIIRSLNNENPFNQKSDFTSDDIDKLYPSLKFLFQFYMQKGYLSNPLLKELIPARFAHLVEDKGLGGIEAINF
jgi:hypothetical protein